MTQIKQDVSPHAKVLVGSKVSINYIESTLKYPDVRLISAEGVSYVLNKAVLACVSQLFKKVLQCQDSHVEGGSSYIDIYTEVSKTELSAFCHFAAYGVIPAITKLDPTTTEAFASLGVDLTSLPLVASEMSNICSVPVFKTSEVVPSKLLQPKIEVIEESDIEDLPLKKRFQGRGQHKRLRLASPEPPPYQSLPDIDEYFTDPLNCKTEIEDDQYIEEDQYIEDEQHSISGDVPQECNGKKSKSEKVRKHGTRGPDGKFKKKRKPGTNTTGLKRKRDPRLFYFPQEGERDTSLKFQCTKCVRGFHSRDSLRQHVYRHDAKGPHETWACLLCLGEVRFEHHSDMLEHKKNVHDEGTNLQCEECGKKLYSKAYYERHMATLHSPPTSFVTCICCGKKFPKQGLLNEHLRARGEFHNNKCPQCPDVVFKSWEEHREHVAKTHGGNFVFRCRFCPEYFETDTIRRHHQTLNHGINAKNDVNKEAWREKIVCDLCGKSVFKRHLGQHIISVHGPKNFKCDQCDKNFQTQAVLNNHKKFIHTYTTCELCGKVSTRKNHRRHNLKHHTPEHLKPYQCSICDPVRGFISSVDLNDHMNTHTGEKPYECNICSAAFRSNGNLAAHIRSTHKGIKRSK